MIIKNFDELATNREKKDALGILEAGLDAAAQNQKRARVHEKGRT